MADYRLRPATGTDAAAIALIYNQGIEDRLATLETELRTPEERRQWLSARSPRHPVVVAEDGGVVIGWGSLNPFSARAAYRFVADFSVYVERSWRGRGVGRVLLTRLIELGREHGYHKLVLSAFPFNRAGVRSTRDSASARSVSIASRACSTASGSTPSSWRSSCENSLHAADDRPRTRRHGP
jgi:L-amino acid N-acyltransferase YncA